MNPLLVKMLIIAVLLTLVLLFPFGRVESLIAERAALRDTAVGAWPRRRPMRRSSAPRMMVVAGDPYLGEWGRKLGNQVPSPAASSVDVTGTVGGELRRSGI